MKDLTVLPPAGLNTEKGLVGRCSVTEGNIWRLHMLKIRKFRAISGCSSIVDLRSTPRLQIKLDGSVVSSMVCYEQKGELRAE